MGSGATAPGAGPPAAGTGRVPAVTLPLRELPEERFDIRIGRDGTWYHRGEPIRRQAMVRLFATVLRRDEAGDFWLATPVERGRIEVEDTPFTAVEVDVRGEGPDAVLAFRTNLDETVEAGPGHPIRVAPRAGGAGAGVGPGAEPDSGEPRPHIEVRPGLEARLLRPVFYALAERAVEHDGRWGVWSRGLFFPLDQAPAA